MPKRIYENGKVTMVLDETDPKDKLELKKKEYKGKALKKLASQEKVDLFDAYVSAGVI